MRLTKDEAQRRGWRSVSVCKRCGCPDIEAEMWVGVNTEEIIDDAGHTRYWCPCCDEQIEGYWCELGIDLVNDECDNHIGGEECASEINWDWSKNDD